ncbi:MAG: ferrous iron transport protein B [Flavobacteriaceae bacterium]
MTQKSKKLKIALVGNPNTGKTSLFNELTGLNQKVGNYPGVTVDKKLGIFNFEEVHVDITDLPGTYSINPSSKDEGVVINTLLNEDGSSFPDLVVVVAEIENLKRNLFLFTQIRDLGFPVILAVNMIDRIDKKGIRVDREGLEAELGTPIIWLSARKKIGIDTLKKTIISAIEPAPSQFDKLSQRISPKFFNTLNEIATELNLNLYQSWLLLTQRNYVEIPYLRKQIIRLEDVEEGYDVKSFQRKETILRYKEINDLLKKYYRIDFNQGTGLRAKFDQLLTHKVFGYVIFLLILFVIFQSVFDIASYPMDAIDGFFANLSAKTEASLPPGPLTELISEGLIPGIGGVVIFIPQIAILFFFLGILEETGYMSRVVFLMDKVMRKFGMSGKSVIPLVSGTACAIPAVMASRNINDWKERLITILVTPLTTCSARLPVYAILIALVIPDIRVGGVFGLQGLVLTGLYVLGFLMAIIGAIILNKALKIKSKNFFIIEMPTYKWPSIKNLGFEVYEKTKSFVLGAGKIILALSIVLWFLASNGSTEYQQADVDFPEIYSGTGDFDQELSSYKLEKSYVGQMGKGIEPVLEPLGYDWKIGIAIVTSFAAREVFVSTLATIYSVGDSDDEVATIKDRMMDEVNPETGTSRFNLATGMSLMLFYAFAMQCMGTLAVVKKETKSWYWPITQFIVMGLLAYVSALIAYQILS